jgi:DNA-binding beta-propeller fold protein YncE
MAWEIDLPTPGWGVTIDPDGHIWVSTADGSFELYDREGGHVGSWGTEEGFDFTNQHGSFGGVAFRPDGGFYVSDVDHARIVEFDGDRGFVRSFGTFGNEDGQLVSPDTIGLDDAGNIHVLDIVRGDIQVFEPDGAHVRTFGQGEIGPFMEVDPDGTVYAVDEEVMALNAYRPDGTKEAIADLAGLMSFATGIVRTPEGRTFVASELSGTSEIGPEHLAEVTADGTVAHLWPNGGWNFAVDPAGDQVYFALQPEGKLRAYALPAG